MKGLTEGDLARAYTKSRRTNVLGGARTPDADLDEERRRPGIQGVYQGVHPCTSCGLALIPDNSPRVLCQFCLRTKLLQRAPGQGITVQIGEEHD